MSAGGAGRQTAGGARSRTATGHADAEPGRSAATKLARLKEGAQSSRVRRETIERHGPVCVAAERDLSARQARRRALALVCRRCAPKSSQAPMGDAARSAPSAETIPGDRFCPPGRSPGPLKGPSRPNERVALSPREGLSCSTGLIKARAKLSRHGAYGDEVGAAWLRQERLQLHQASRGALLGLGCDFAVPNSLNENGPPRHPRQAVSLT